MIRFRELLPLTGVDEYPDPAGMVISLGDSNVVVLETDGKEIDIPPVRGIKIERFTSNEVAATIQKLRDINIALSQDGVDPQISSVKMPTQLYWYSKPLLLRIHGTLPIDFPGVEVKAKAGGRTVAILKVVVLKTMPVKIAIRNVQVRDDSGRIVFHSTKPCDPVKELDNMNAVWTPQTNMKFDLVPSAPALVDIQDKETRMLLGKGYGLKDPMTATFRPRSEVNPSSVREVFTKLMIPQAHITFFLVDSLKDGVHGTMHRSGLGFVQGNHLLTTFAHEAGHFLGGKIATADGARAKTGEWDNLAHVYDLDKAGNPTSEDFKLLMRDNGSSWKIPFSSRQDKYGKDHSVKDFRSFFNRHPVH